MVFIFSTISDTFFLSFSDKPDYTISLVIFACCVCIVVILVSNFCVVFMKNKLIESCDNLM
jgi:hypothetical protein